jgi:cytidylate kinase
MSVRVITIEREYGSGGAAIARRLAAQLDWKLWDEELTAEIARVANVDANEVQRRDEHVETPLRRLFKVFARGSYERALPIGEGFDTDQMVVVLEKVIADVASRGNCVIVGRGSPYILRKRADACHFFIHAPSDEKMRRLNLVGKSEKEAMQLLTEVDRERATFIQHYFSKQWPTRALYDLMINSKFGDEHVIETILRHVEAINKRQERG